MHDVCVLADVRRHRSVANSRRGRGCCAGVCQLVLAAAVVFLRTFFAALFTDAAAFRAASAATHFLVV